MTANQIAYARLAEDQRSHQATENLKSVELSEIQRSNRENEAVNWFTAKNQNAHYERMDQETYRSNTARETETHRSNLAKEFETNRSNVANESINAFRANTERSQYYENVAHNREEESRKAYEASTARRNQQESARHNAEMEKITSDYNLAQEQLGYEKLLNDLVISEQQNRTRLVTSLGSSILGNLKGWLG